MAEKPAATKAPEAEDVPKKDKGKDKLVVRLFADYWDAEGVRHTASYIDENGEKRESGALVELPADEARKLVKTAAAERGDEY